MHSLKTPTNYTPNSMDTIKTRNQMPKIEVRRIVTADANPTLVAASHLKCLESYWCRPRNSLAHNSVITGRVGFYTLVFVQIQQTRYNMLIS